jgi:hypothetical protein
VPIVALIIVAIMKKFNIGGYNPEQVARVINIVLKAIGWVEKNENVVGKGKAKLETATDIALKQLSPSDIKLLKKIGKKPVADSFGDRLLDGVQNIFINSASGFLQKKADKFIGKM